MRSEPLKIDQRIIGWTVRTVEEEKKEIVPILDVTYDRDGPLEGTTYKIKPASLDCAMYITINHITLPDGTKRPIEMFINSKHPDQHQWVTALTRMVSAVFRKPGPIDFAIEELEQVYDPNGGYWDGPNMRPSIIAHVGSILRQHCEKIGAINSRELSTQQKAVIDEKKIEAENAGIKMQLCSKCKETAVILMDGCLTCTACGDSKCQ